MNNMKLPGMLLATIAAGVFTAGCDSPPADTSQVAMVHCEGVNSCKGTSACKSANNACKGQNSCKGHGFLELSKEDCAAAKAKG